MDFIILVIALLGAFWGAVANYRLDEIEKKK